MNIVPRGAHDGSVFIVTVSVNSLTLLAVSPSMREHWQRLCGASGTPASTTVRDSANCILECARRGDRQTSDGCCRRSYSLCDRLGYRYPGDESQTHRSI